jgi:hypothetical protein
MSSFFLTRKIVASVLLFLSTMAVVDVCVAHPGPVDRNGCHLDGQGRRHCH